MKDTQLRGVILAKYYERRREPNFTPDPSDFDPPISIQDIFAISGQLGQHGLITWSPLRGTGGPVAGMGQITAFGIDVVEGAATSDDIKLEFVQNKTVNITGSSNVVVGDNNQITLTQYVDELAHLIDNSSGTSEQKAEAKSILQSFLEHPLVTAIAGGIAGGAIELLRDR